MTEEYRRFPNPEETHSTGSKFMIDFIIDFRRADKNLQCLKAMGFSRKNRPNT